jgi:hypothetical protein
MDAGVTLSAEHRILSRPTLLELLEKLSAAPGGDALSVYVPPHLPPQELENLLRAIPAPRETAAQLADLAGGSGTGAVIFWGPEHKYLVVPPFDMSGKRLAHGFSMEHLRALLNRQYLIAILLVRLGAYAVGVCRGDKIISSKVGTGLVHGRHRQGGSSAHRFERHRDKQIEYFFTRVCQRAREHFEPHLRSFDFHLYGGARTTIRLLQKQCDWLRKLTSPALSPLLDIPEPRQAVLEQAVTRIWSSSVTEWRRA